MQWIAIARIYCAVLFVFYTSEFFIAINKDANKRQEEAHFVSFFIDHLRD